jgi:hypothetical protein
MRNTGNRLWTIMTLEEQCTQNRGNSENGNPKVVEEKIGAGINMVLRCSGL